MLASCENSVQPAAEADERAGGPVDVPDAVQQPPPAAQRPGVGQVGDRLFHQRAQPCLQAVERPLLLGELVFGAAVTDRGMPVLARLGQAAEPAVQQAGDLDLVQRGVEPRQLDELLLVAARRPATLATQPGRPGPPRSSSPPDPERCGRGAGCRTGPSGWPTRMVVAPGSPTRPRRPPRRPGPSPPAGRAAGPGG